MDFSMSSALLRGLSQDANTIDQQLPFICATGNCTFDAFESLSVCASCSDVTASLRKTVIHDGFAMWEFFTDPSVTDPSADTAYSSDSDWTNFDLAIDLTEYDLPSGAAIWNADANSSAGVRQVAMTALPIVDPAQTVTFQHHNLMFFALAMIKADFTMQPNGNMSTWPHVPVTATECALSFCVKRITSSVENGILSERMVPLPSTRSADSWLPIDKNTQVAKSSVDGLKSSDIEGNWTSRTDLQIVLRNNETETFNVSQVGVDGMEPGFLQFFPQMSKPTQDDGDTNALMLLDNTSTVSATTSTMQALWNSPNITKTFENLALSMTNQIRQSDDKNSYIKGNTRSSVTIIRVNWGWAALPIGLVLLSCIFLCLSAWETRKSRQPIWKDGSLPILLHQLENSPVKSGIRHSLHEMKQMAGIAKVQLMDRGNAIVLGMCYRP